MNHFPFALRNALMLPFTPETDRRRHINVAGAAMGYPGARVILQDVSVEASFPLSGGVGGLVNELPQITVSNRTGGVLHLLMRLGWKGKGYLTEELLPYSLFLNQAKPLTPTWNFIRPYRMDPGEALTASMWPLGLAIGSTDNCGIQGSNGVNFGKCVGLMFHGIRIKDGAPILLYDADQELICIEDEETYVPASAMTAQTLACPADSSILLHSVSVSNFDLVNYRTTEGLLGTMLQIYSPSGRAWMSSIMSDLFPPLAPWIGFTEQEAATFRHWVDPIGASIALGEERGWLKEASEQITVELELPTGAKDQIGLAAASDASEWPVLVTVRGCLEVPDA